MSHPMEGWLEDRCLASAALWERRDKVESIIADAPLSKFKASQLTDLELLFDRDASLKRKNQLEAALTRLEAFINILNY